MTLPASCTARAQAPGPSSVAAAATSSTSVASSSRMAHAVHASAGGIAPSPTLPAPLGRSPPPFPPSRLPAGIMHASTSTATSSPAALRRAASLDWAGAWVDPEQRRRMMSLAHPAGPVDPESVAAPSPGEAEAGRTSMTMGARRVVPGPSSTRLVRPVARRASEDLFPRRVDESVVPPPSSPHRLRPPSLHSHSRSRTSHAAKHAHHRPHPPLDMRAHHRSLSLRTHNLPSTYSPMGSPRTPTSAAHRAHSTRRRSRRSSLKRKARAETQWARLRGNWALLTVCVASLAWNWALYRFAQAWKLDVRAASLPAAAAAQGHHAPRQHPLVPSQAPLWVPTVPSDTPAALSRGGFPPLFSTGSGGGAWLRMSSVPAPARPATSTAPWPLEKFWFWRLGATAQPGNAVALDATDPSSRGPFHGSSMPYTGPRPVPTSSEGVRFASSFMPWSGTEEDRVVRKDTSTLWPDLLRVYALTGLACSIFGVVGIVRDDWRCFLVYVVQQIADFAIVVVDAIILAVSLYHPAMQLYVCYLFSPSGSVPLGPQDDSAAQAGMSFARAPSPMTTVDAYTVSASPSLGALPPSLSSSSSSSSSFNLLSELTSLDYASAQCALRVRNRFIPPLWAAILVSSALRSLVLVHAVRYLRRARWRTKRRAAQAHYALPMDQTEILPPMHTVPYGAPASHGGSARPSASASGSTTGHTASPSPARSFLTSGAESPEPHCARSMASQAVVPVALLSSVAGFDKTAAGGDAYGFLASPVAAPDEGPAGLPAPPLDPLLGTAPAELSHAGVGGGHAHDPAEAAQLLELAWQEDA